jgi:hypothetical protein
MKLLLMVYRVKKQYNTYTYKASDNGDTSTCNSDARDHTGDANKNQSRR